MPLPSFVLLHLLVIFPALASSYEVSGIKVHRVPLRQDESSPFCFAASSALDVMARTEGGDSTPINFLASQVWPSARVAASALEKHMDPAWTVCEFGCGPALPSLTAAKLGAQKVYATDLDQFALELVDHASHVQDLSDIISTRTIDITLEPRFSGSDHTIPKADLYLFSDIFESTGIAIGAAAASQAILQNVENARIWVFAQSDRACREDYLREMRRLLDDPDLAWIPLDQYDRCLANRLFLFDLDETTVSYG